MSHRFGRREFLLGLAAIPVAGALGACSDGNASLREALLDFHPDRDSARALGAEYLKAFPEQDDSALLDLLTGSAARASEWQALAVSDPGALHESIREQHFEDFRAGRTLILSGWVLSETELRLCALVARAG